MTDLNDQSAAGGTSLRP